MTQFCLGMSSDQTEAWDSLAEGFCVPLSCHFISFHFGCEDISQGPDGYRFRKGLALKERSIAATPWVMTFNRA